MTAEEAEALIDDIEDAARVGITGALGLALEDALDEIVLALLGAGRELQVAADRAELVDGHLAKIGDVQIVPLAGGFELLLFLVIGDGGARRPPDCGGGVANFVNAGRDRVGAWVGQSLRGNGSGERGALLPAQDALQKFGSRIVNRAAGTELPDAASGFRAYSRESLMLLNTITRFSYCMETIIQAGNKKLKIASIPVVTNPKTRESRLFTLDARARA